jgi:hypothetical protein
MEAQRIASPARIRESALVSESSEIGGELQRRAAGFGVISQSQKETRNMKKTATIASQVWSIAFLTLCSIPLAQGQNYQSSLVQTVRNATQQYASINSALAAGYGPFLGCVSGTDHGAMGFHYVNPNLLNGTIDVTKPQALIYEPSNGQLELVGVEYIVDSATWLMTHSGPPVLAGQVFLLVTSPNRFNIPAFFELHVWAWRDNPHGSFMDWNDNVSCENQ